MSYSFGLKNKTKNILLIVILFFLLHWSYVVSISEVYRYMGFRKLNLSPFANFYVLLIIIGMGLIISKMKTSPFIYTVANLFLVFMLIPNLILHQFGEIHFGIILSIIFFIFSILILGRIKWKITAKLIPKKYRIFYLLSLTILMIIPVFLAFKFDVNLNNLFLQEIYDQRLIAREKKTFLVKYFDPWLSKIILPILFVYCMHYKYRFLMFFTGILIVYMFLTGAHKTVFVTLFVIVGFALMKTHERQLNLTLWVSIFFILIARFLYSYFNFFLLDTGFTRRIFFIPALLNKQYFEFFEGKPVYLAHSIFKSFIDYPYEVPPPFVIGIEYYGNVLMSANNGIISDGYLNFGYWGVVIFSILCGLFFSMLNSLELSCKFFGIIFLYIFAVISGAFLTSLLTKGGILFVIIGFLFLRKSAFTMDTPLYPNLK